ESRGLAGDLLSHGKSGEMGQFLGRLVKSTRTLIRASVRNAARLVIERPGSKRRGREAVGPFIATQQHRKGSMMLDEHDEDGSQEIEVLAGQEAERDDYDFPVVGIGASAGGLEALERLFRSLPSDTGMAFVIVQHLSPDFRSLMDELLARQT